MQNTEYTSLRVRKETAARLEKYMHSYELRSLDAAISHSLEYNDMMGIFLDVRVNGREDELKEEYPEFWEDYQNVIKHFEKSEEAQNKKLS
jgi:hypothetical protein